MGTAVKSRQPARDLVVAEISTLPLRTGFTGGILSRHGRKPTLTDC